MEQATKSLLQWAKSTGSQLLSRRPKRDPTLSNRMVVPADINIPEILTRRYPNLEWRIDNNDYDTLVVFNGVRPPFAELRTHSPSVVEELAQEAVLAERYRRFQRQYPIQRQLVILMNAIGGDLLDYVSMRDFYNSL